MTKLVSLIAIVGLVISTILVIVAHNGDLDAAMNSLGILAGLASSGMITSLVAVGKVEKLDNKLSNGLIPEKVQEAVDQGIIQPGPANVEGRGNEPGQAI